MTARWFPPPSKPLPAEGGMQARSKRGVIGESWWSARFVAVLEQIGLGSRLQRGRSYARKGQVMSLTVDAGVVAATVQGSRSRPYRVRIGLPAFGKVEWSAVERELAASAWFAAELLAGSMPTDIENAFADAGLELFPADAEALSMDCSCPDWEVPCKHLAAVFYLLAETFDDDPFAILAWRGREREDLLANLRSLRSDGPPAADAAASLGKPLGECLDSFFAMQAPLGAAVAARAPAAPLLDQVADIGLQVRGRPITELLGPAYAAFDPPGPVAADPDGR